MTVLGAGGGAGAVRPQGSSQVTELQAKAQQDMQRFQDALRANQPSQPVRPGPSGVISYEGSTFQASRGALSVNGQQVGTLDRSGNFDVTVNGQRHQGNLSELKGVSTFLDGRPNHAWLSGG